MVIALVHNWTFIVCYLYVIFIIIHQYNINNDWNRNSSKLWKIISIYVYICMPRVHAILYIWIISFIVNNWFCICILQLLLLNMISPLNIYPNNYAHSCDDFFRHISSPVEARMYFNHKSRVLFIIHMYGYIKPSHLFVKF